MFDKGYSYKAPLTVKISSSTPYFITLDQKSEFTNVNNTINLDWEYKIKNEMTKCTESILCSSKKAEAEFELWTQSKNLSSSRSIL